MLGISVVALLSLGLVHAVPSRSSTTYKDTGAHFGEMPPPELTKILVQGENGEAVEEYVENFPRHYQPPNNTDNKIFNGYFVWNPIPYQVSLQFKQSGASRWTHTCGGSVISNNRILSAAHCFPSELQSVELRAVFGTTRYDAPRQAIIYTYNDIVLDKEYTEQRGTVNFPNDNAVIKLRQHISFNEYVAPICLAQSESQADWYMASGWGYYNCDRTPTDLRFAHGLPVERRQCSEMYTEDHGTQTDIDDGQICFHFEQSNGDLLAINKGDSGGPLVGMYAKQFRQIGIVSWASFMQFSNGQTCINPRIPQVFSSVVHYQDFIKQNAPDAKFC